MKMSCTIQTSLAIRETIPTIRGRRSSRDRCGTIQAIHVNEEAQQLNSRVDRPDIIFGAQRDNIGSDTMPPPKRRSQGDSNGAKMITGPKRRNQGDRMGSKGRTLPKTSENQEKICRVIEFKPGGGLDFGSPKVS